MRQMTITEALVELKLLDKRIANSDMQDWCIIQLKQDKKTMTGETVEEYEQETKARFQSVKDLITERANIKKAIVKSNADTVVEVGDLKMTVAEAIEYKTSIEYEKRLLQSLRRSKAGVEEGKIAHEARLDREVSNVIGKLAESGKDNLSEEQKNFTESYRQMNEAIIIDPIDIDKQISELETKIDSFEQNIDVALSVSNATTFIEI